MARDSSETRLPQAGPVLLLPKMTTFLWAYSTSPSPTPWPPSHVDFALATCSVDGVCWNTIPNPLSLCSTVHSSPSTAIFQILSVCLFSCCSLCIFQSDRIRHFWTGLRIAHSCACWQESQCESKHTLPQFIEQQRCTWTLLHTTRTPEGTYLFVFVFADFSQPSLLP